MEDYGFARIISMVETAHTDAAVFPPTYIYNEGWMLRILLSIQSDGIDCFPFSFQSGAKWFSEAYINSPFLRRRKEEMPNGKEDKLAEKHTHPDGVVGHFKFRPNTKLGLILTYDATQFIITEAKMYSDLSPKVKNAPGYDQAARTVACMAWLIHQSNKSVEDFSSLGYYAIAPQSKIDRGIITLKLQKKSISEKVKHRVHSYKDDRKKFKELKEWHNDFFIPMLEYIDIDCISWESIINNVGDPSIKRFYERCKEFNK